MSPQKKLLLRRNALFRQQLTTLPQSGNGQPINGDKNKRQTLELAKNFETQK